MGVRVGMPVRVRVPMPRVVRTHCLLDQKEGEEARQDREAGACLGQEVAEGAVGVVVAVRMCVLVAVRMCVLVLVPSVPVPVAALAVAVAVSAAERVRQNVKEHIAEHAAARKAE